MNKLLSILATLALCATFAGCDSGSGSTADATPSPTASATDSATDSPADSATDAATNTPSSNPTDDSSGKWVPLSLPPDCNAVQYTANDIVVCRSGAAYQWQKN